MINITLIDKKITTAPNKTGKMYQIAELAYKNNSFGGKVEGKKVTEYSKAWKAVAESNVGDTFDVTTEKNGQYVEWVQLSRAGAATPMPKEPKEGQLAQTDGFKAKSSFETAEERAKKQVYIIRQSSLSSAIATLSVGAKAVKVDDVLSLAKQYETYVIEGLNNSGFDDMTNDLQEGPPTLE